MPTNPDFYSILGVNRTASQQQIKRAYRDLAFEYHPDRAQSHHSEAAEEKLKTINQAYAVLSDPRKRRSYDQWGRQGPIMANSVHFSSFNGSHQSRRQQIEVKISSGKKFQIMEFAKELGVKSSNLIKILRKLIEKGETQGVLENGWFIPR